MLKSTTVLSEITAKSIVEFVEFVEFTVFTFINFNKIINSINKILSQREMKNLNALKSIAIIIVMFFSITVSSKANWIKTEQRIESTQSLPDGKAGTPYSQNSKSDTLPEGVTQDWLNKITDENGNRILPATAGRPEDPEVDAFQTS
ncbi:MAG: hypothetical protein ABIY50_01315, partial [Ignavibacteria bacterium]